MTHQHSHLTLKQAARNGLVVFVLSVIVASYKWSVSEFYNFEIYMFISFWSILILPRFVFKFSKPTKKLFGIFGGLVVVVPLSFALLQHIYPFLFSSQFPLNISILLWIFIFSESMGQLIFRYNTERFQSKQSRIFNITSTVLQILCAGFSVQFGINTILTALIIVSTIKIVWVKIILSKTSISTNIQSSNSFLKEKSWIINPTLVALCIDGLLLSILFPASSFLAFRLGSREILMGAIFASTLHQSILLNAKGHLHLSELKSEASRLVRLIFPITISLILISHFAFPILYSYPNLESASFFNTYLLLVLIRIPFPHTIIENQHARLNINRMNYVELGINVLLSLTFAKWFGAIGIAYATILSALLCKIYQIIYCARKFNISPQKYIPLTIYIISSIFLIFVYIFTEHYIY